MLLRCQRNHAVFVNLCFSLTHHLIEDVGGDLIVVQLRLKLCDLGLHVIKLVQLLLNLLLLALILLLFLDQLLMRPPPLGADLTQVC